MKDRDRETLAEALAALKGQRTEIQFRTGQSVPGVVEGVLPGNRAFRLTVAVIAPSPDGTKAKRVGNTSAVYLVEDVLAVVGPMPAPEQRRIEPVTLMPGLPPGNGRPTLVADR